MLSFSKEIRRRARISLSFQDFLDAIHPIPGALLSKTPHKIILRLNALKKGEAALTPFINTLGIEPGVDTLPLPILTSLSQVLHGKFDRMQMTKSPLSDWDTYTDGLLALCQCNSSPELEIMVKSPELSRAISWFRWLQSNYKQCQQNGGALPPFVTHLREYINRPAWEMTSSANLVVDALLRMMIGFSPYTEQISMSTAQQIIIMESNQNVTVQRLLAVSHRFYQKLKSCKCNSQSHLQTLRLADIALNELCLALNPIIESNGNAMNQNLVHDINTVFSKTLNRIGFTDRKCLHHYHQGLSAQILCDPVLAEHSVKLNESIASAVRDLQAHINHLFRQGCLCLPLHVSPVSNQIRPWILAILWDRIDSRLYPR